MTINQSPVLQIDADNAISRPDNPVIIIMALMPRYRTYATVPNPTIPETTAKDASAAVTQVVNSDTANLTIIVNPMTFMTKRRLRTDEVLESVNSLLIPQVHNRE